MRITQQSVDAFMARIAELSDREMASLVASAITDRELLLDIRQARLAEVAAIEKKLDISPTTAECRRIAKGKCNPKGVQK